MPGGRNKSIGPVQVSMSDCFSRVPSSFCSRGHGTAWWVVGSDRGSSSAWDGAGVHLAEPFSALPVLSAGVAGL